jgi:hypothetical protein
MGQSAPKVPGYLLDALLGVGGFGEVWRARRTRDGEPVAIKLLPTPDADQLAAVHAEAAVLAALEHPHLIRLREVVRCPGALALVLDLAGGGSLAALLAARGRLTPGEAVTALAPVAAALAYAHNAGVVHGDVSAANVLFTAIGLPLLADLGVARLAGDVSLARSTPAYVEPTVAAGGLPTAPADVFMLGGVALHALTGSPPWPGPAGGDPLVAAAAGELGDVGARLRAADVPDEVAAVVLRALAPNPNRRATAAEFALDLRHATEPVAVDLHAGRAPRAAGPRHAAQPFTRIVPRAERGPQQPPDRLPARRRAPWRPGRRAARVCLVVLGGLGVASICAAVWLPSGASAPPSGRPAGAHPSASAGGSAAARPGRPAGTSNPGGSGVPDVPAVEVDAAGAATILAGLDQLRARAYAQRSPDLLAQVYAADPLLRQDRARLVGSVPVGCVLDGVQTRYQQVRVTARAPGRIELTVEVSLSPSRLTCAGSAAGVAPGSGPTALHVVLLAPGAGPYRIASITG